MSSSYVNSKVDMIHPLGTRLVAPNTGVVLDTQKNLYVEFPLVQTNLFFLRFLGGMVEEVIN